MNTDGASVEAQAVEVLLARQFGPGGFLALDHAERQNTMVPFHVALGGEAARGGVAGSGSSGAEGEGALAVLRRAFEMADGAAAAGKASNVQVAVDQIQAQLGGCNARARWVLLGVQANLAASLGQPEKALTLTSEAVGALEQRFVHGTLRRYHESIVPEEPVGESNAPSNSLLRSSEALLKTVDAGRFGEIVHREAWLMAARACAQSLELAAERIANEEEDELNNLTAASSSEEYNLASPNPTRGDGGGGVGGGGDGGYGGAGPHPAGTSGSSASGSRAGSGETANGFWGSVPSDEYDGAGTSPHTGRADGAADSAAAGVPLDTRSVLNDGLIESNGDSIDPQELVLQLLSKLETLFRFTCEVRDKGWPVPRLASPRSESRMLLDHALNPPTHPTFRPPPTRRCANRTLATLR